MSRMLAGNALREIERGNLRPVYFLHGEEEYTKREILRAIVSQFDPALLSLNRDTLYGEEVQARDLQGKLYALPMLAERRLVTVHNVNPAPEATRDLLLQYARKPVPTTILVLMAPKVDIRKTVFWSQLAEAASSISSSPLSLEALPEWTKRKARETGKQWSDDAVRLLIKQVGSNLSGLASEIEKTAALVGEGVRVEVDDVRSVLGLSRPDQYALAQAIARCDLRDSLEVLENLLEWGEGEGAIMYSLNRDFRTLWKMRLLLDRGANRDEFARASRVHPFYAPQYLKLAPNRSGPGWEKCLHQVYQAERTIKSGRGRPEHVLRLLVYSLCREGQDKSEA